MLPGLALLRVGGWPAGVRTRSLRGQGAGPGSGSSCPEVPSHPCVCPHTKVCGSWSPCAGRSRSPACLHPARVSRTEECPTPRDGWTNVPRDVHVLTPMGRTNVPRDVHTPIPEACARVTVRGQRDRPEMTLRTLTRSPCRADPWGDDTAPTGTLHASDTHVPAGGRQSHGRERSPVPGDTGRSLADSGPDGTPLRPQASLQNTTLVF